MTEKFLDQKNNSGLESDFPVFTGKHEKGSTNIFKKIGTLAALSSLTLLSAQNKENVGTKNSDGSWSLRTVENIKTQKKENSTFVYKPEKKQIKNKNEFKKIENWQPPIVDNFEYYNPLDTYNNGKNSIAYHNYMNGNFKYHEIKNSFKGTNSSFWRARNLELGRDLYDSRIPLKPGEYVEKLKADQLMITDFSVKDGEKYDRAVIVKKGTDVILNSSGHIIALADCCNDNHVSMPLCPPGQEKI